MIKNVLCSSVVAVVLSAFFPVAVMADGPTVSVTSPAMMTPQTPQIVTVTVDMGTDTLASLGNVTLKLWYDSNGGVPTSTDFDDATPGFQTCATIIWDSVSTFFSLTPAGTTWSLGSCTAPSPLTAHSGDFVFHFTPGIVATEASGSALWQIGAKATTGSGSQYGFSTGAQMLLYQVLSFSSAPIVSWGAVAAGMGFADSPPSMTALGQTITILSNSNWTMTSQSSSTWSGQNSHTATLDSTGSTDQHFSLKAANGTTNSSALILTSNPGPFDSGSSTTEEGVIYSNIHVWLKLAGVFYPDSYNGSINFSVTQ